MTTTTDTTFDASRVEAFAGHLMTILKGGLLSCMVDIGYRTGLFVAAAAGETTSGELAARAHLEERYVREWLGAMVTEGIIEYDAAAQTYRLPPEHATLLTGPMSMAPIAQANTVLAKHVQQIVRVFEEGGGVPYAEFCPEFSEALDAMGRGPLDQFLVSGYLPVVPGLTEKLAAGARVADFACGAGHALVILARAFPASTFIGYDLDEGAVRRARAEAAGAGLANLAFEVRDITRLRVDAPFDVVFMMDALHDQVDPPAVLARVRDALAADGVFLLREPHAGDRLEDNVGNPTAPIMYSVSTLHCLTVSLAHGGAGIGTAFGEGLARTLLADAGFAPPAIHPAPGTPFDAIYVTRVDGS